MAYVVETNVNESGYLFGGVDSIPDLVMAQHPWAEPFPTVPGEISFTWKRGRARGLSNVLHHNLLRDFACDADTYEFLHKLVGPDLHVVARGRVGDAEFVVVQAVAVFDVVDRARSIPYKYAEGGVSYPHIPASNEDVVRGHMFRAPDVGLSLTVLVADDVKEAIEAHGISGFRFERADVEQDD